MVEATARFFAACYLKIFLLAREELSYCNTRVIGCAVILFNSSYWIDCVCNRSLLFLMLIGSQIFAPYGSPGQKCMCPFFCSSFHYFKIQFFPNRLDTPHPSAFGNCGKDLFFCLSCGG
jgi:hypothetical protein